MQITPHIHAIKTPQDPARRVLAEPGILRKSPLQFMAGFVLAELNATDHDELLRE
jgi:hypothetical protein